MTTTEAIVTVIVFIACLVFLAWMSRHARGDYKLPYEPPQKWSSETTTTTTTYKTAKPKAPKPQRILK